MRRAAGVALALVLLIGGGSSAPAQPAFALTRLELVFPNGRGDLTVPLRYPGLRAFGLLRFTLNGVLHATWKVDGQILGAVVESTFGEDLIIATPELPTFQPGLHRVTLEVREPRPGFTVPTITYFVTAEDYEDFRKRTEKAR